ncbi:MAG TPA: succinate dehydrogenase hydrophobic membrane anchor subunit [Chloroflexota bacterium]|nr:succinate dehydrogenase hydrophobic membrane anchor subunit [Chloroflexota bacterium]
MSSVIPGSARTPAPRRARPGGGSNFELYTWFFMRVSGVFLLFLVFGHVLIVHVINEISAVNYLFVAQRWESPFWRTYDWLMLVLALAHGTNGLRTLIDDYVHRPAYRVLSLAALASFALVFVIVGSLVILTFEPVAPR